VSVAPSSPTRRHDLDWIRIGAFGLLILYHVGLAYGPWDWHLHSAHWMEGIREAVLITNPWRLTLLFLVSGAAVRFMTVRRTPGEVARMRVARLGPPLIFGVLVLVTIQSWIEAMDKIGWDQGYPAWLIREFSPSGIANGVPFNHLWFVTYIAAYSAVVVALLYRPKWIAFVEERLGDWLSGWRLLWIPMLYLVVARVVLFPPFGLTNNLTWDWYNHAQSLAAFLFGFFAARNPAVWAGFERLRWPALAIACVALPTMMLQVAHPGGGAFWGVPRNVVVAIDQWSVMVAILGFASLHLRKASGPVLSYLNEAVFPLYLAHQTLLVVALWWVRPAGLPVWLEAPILVAFTLGGSLLVYECVRRVGLLRPIWGLRPVPHVPALPHPGAYRKRRLLLAVGAAAPVIAILAVALALSANPGFDNATRFLSELGGSTASMPAIFNGGVFLAGVLAGVAGVGFGLALMTINRARIAGVLTAVVFVLAGIGLAASALIPWPDPRHVDVLNLALGIQIAPLLLLWGLAADPKARRLKIFLMAAFVIMVILTVVTKHLVFPGTVNPANVGWWERIYALVLVAWVAVTALALGQRLKSMSSDSPKSGAD
jgi:hypothetical membrane protein/peptidoglycan/LPS O-acetylase OafA/YrhL